jgi:CubicO group peptidase (beta-lactamase class C family)
MRGVCRDPVHPRRRHRWPGFAWGAGRALLLWLPTVLPAGGAWAQGLPVAAPRAAGLPSAAPEAAGFSPERLERLTSAFLEYVEREELPGAVILLARHGKVAYLEAFGMLDRERGIPMPTDGVFRNRDKG